MSILSIMSLWLLAACNGGNSDDTGNQPDTEDCDDVDGGECDTGTDPGTGFATINIGASFLGTVVDCVVMVDGILAGNTGEDIDITAEHTHTVGVGYENEFGLFIHTLETWNGDSTWNGANIVSPSWDVKLDPDEFEDVEVTYSLYPVNANSYWSCTNDRNGGVSTDIAETDGATFYMPGIGEMALSGVSLDMDESTSGSFTSISTATIVSVQSETSSITQTCHASDSDGNPV